MEKVKICVICRKAFFTKKAREAPSFRAGRDSALRFRGSC